MFKIAVVEDEHLESEALCKMINEHGDDWRIVAIADSGVEAIEKIRQTSPDIILLDINIPDINGLEVLRRVKDEDPFKRVIIITAFNEFEFAHQAIKAHVDDFLLKPIRPEQLYDSIDNVSKTIKRTIEEQFGERMNDVFYGIANHRYTETRKALHTFVEILYSRYDKDLLRLQERIDHFLTELNKAVKGICEYPIPDVRKMFRAEPSDYKDSYQLYVQLKRVIDRIFDILLDNDGGRRNTMEGILNYVDRNCYKDITLNQVGEYANMSSYYLSKIFKKETGVNFVTYLTNRKIELAKDMLTYTDIPIINIALELSYHEPNYFSKVFKKSTGITPTEYRKRKKSELMR